MLPLFFRRTEFLVVAILAIASVVAAWAVPRPVPAAFSVAIPVVWGCLFLYPPSRLAAWWAWRQVERAAPRVEDRRALGLVLLLAFGLLIWGLDWGLIEHSWAADELRPDWARDVLHRGLSSGWCDKYPWMHYAVLAIPVSAFDIADRYAILASGSPASWAAQLALMRVVSVLMGLGTLVAAYLCGVELIGARRAVLGPLALLLTPVFVFYGKTANLDVPSLCWFGWALVAFLRIVRINRLPDYVWLGVAAAGAVATKDQAYANLGLLALAIIIVQARRQASPKWWGKLRSALVDSRVLAAGVAAVLASVVFHNLAFNFGGFVSHIKVLSTLGDLAIVPRTAAGYVELTGRTVALFRWSLGWPLFVMAVAGVASALARKDRRWWLWLLLPPLSFHLTFTWVTLYVCDRYLFGGDFVLALFAGAACADLIEAVRWRPAARLAVAVSFVYALLYASSVNVMMNLDARHAARRWISAHADERTVIALVGRSYMPRLDPPIRATVVNASLDEVTRVAPDLVVLNARFAQRFERASSPEGRELMRALEDGSLGFAEAFRYRTPIPAWALLQYEAPFLGSGESGVTNLDKINPEMVIYRRRHP